MPTYKTPDVYVEEVSIFPPSIAEVETAVPAFIGYTAKANYDGKNLLNQAVKISSLVEFQENFGYGPTFEITLLDLSADNEVTSVSLTKASKFLLYDSVRMFYDNGGGNCYIISIGSYSDTPTKDAFMGGLDVLQAEDEPTMIVFPDAVLLSDSDLYALQQQALLQAATLMDRFVIMDIRESATGSNALRNQAANIQTFRDAIGINNLKYGAAYAPHIVSNFAKYLKFSQIKDVMKREGVPFTARELAGDNPSPAFLTAINNYDFLNDDNGNFKTKLTAAIQSVVDDSSSKTLDQEFKSLVMVYKKADNTAAEVAALKNLTKFVGLTIDHLGDNLAQGATAFKYPQLLADIQTKCKSTYNTLLGQILCLNITYGTLNQDEEVFGSYAYPDLVNVMVGDAKMSLISHQVSADVDPDTKFDIRPIFSFSQGTRGAVTVKDTWKLEYRPSANDYVGPDSYTVTFPDETKTVFVGVFTDALTGKTVKAVAKEEVDVLIAEGVGAAGFAVSPEPTKGTVTRQDSGRLDYTAAAGQVGEDKFSFTTGEGDAATTTHVCIMIFDTTRETLDAGPVLTIKKGAMASLTLGALANVAAVTPSDHGGTVTLAAGELSYRPVNDFTGEDTFSYTINYFAGEPYAHLQTYEVTANVAKPDEVNGLFIDEISDVFDEVNAAVLDTQTSLASYDRQFEDAVKTQLPALATLLKETEKRINVLPPSGAMAGVYSRIDETRGVWKAPANVSLNSVVDVTAKIDNNFQEDMNVDVTAGKSVNAIRPFAGKGILVWGGRTLAGNDNEWRYVSVRRFFNMVEESCKKSTYWAVFEPNDANLWIKVKAMIENYLTDKWRDGALQGAKPEQAFYVNVGLGVTMSAQDILEGRLIVDIGMAVVRPAEFIVLRFMHKMLES